MNSDDRKRYLILKDPNIIKGLLILSFPLMINNLIRTLHDVIDTYFVSQIEGYTNEAINSISTTFPVTFMYISFGMGLGIAGTALISQFYGANQIDTARKYATHLSVIAIIIGVVLTIVSLIFAPLIMRLIGAEGYVLTHSVEYLRIRALELPFLFLFFAFSSMRQSSGDTITPVILGVIAMIINIILSPILIQVFDMGVSGAAYATLIANTLIMPPGIILMFKSKTGITIDLKYIKLQAQVSMEIIRTALPAALGQAMTAIGFAVLTAFILDYGDATYTAFSVGNRLSSIFLHPVMAIGGVMAAYIGQNIGNQNPERARKTLTEGIKISMLLMAIGSLVGIYLRAPLAGIFLDSGGDSHILATTYMFYLFAGLPLMAIYQAYIGVFNGTGHTKYTFAIGFSRLWLIRIPLIMIFKNYTSLGSSGIWYAMLLSNFMIAFVGFFLLKNIDFKPKIELEPILT